MAGAAAHWRLRHLMGQLSEGGPATKHWQEENHRHHRRRQLAAAAAEHTAPHAAPAGAWLGGPENGTGPVRCSQPSAVLPACHA